MVLWCNVNVLSLIPGVTSSRKSRESRKSRKSRESALHAHNKSAHNAHMPTHKSHMPTHKSAHDSANELPKSLNFNRRKRKMKTYDFASQFIAKKMFIDVFHGKKSSYDQQMASLGVWTRERLIDLGPTFVKIGQLASTRSDVLCSAFATELSLLQDSCPVIEEFDAEAFVEGELNIDIGDEFQHFEQTPFKAASIGQCHLATLRNGNRVVVKIQRPGIQELIKEDLRSIKEVLISLSRLQMMNEYDNALFNESEKYLLDEINYQKEAENALRIRDNLMHDPSIIVPRVSRRLSTNRVLTMEYIAGRKITELKKMSSKKKAIQLLNDCFLRQFLQDGIIHGDPHPGNLAYSKGKLILYDFGILIDISQIMQDSFDKVMMSVFQRDAKQLTEILLEADLIIPTGNKSDIVYFFDAIFTSISPVNMKSISSDQKFDFNFKKSIRVLQEHGFDDSNRPFTFKNDVIYLGKCISLLDGLFRDLDPDYDPVALVKPFVDEKVSKTDIDFDWSHILQIPSKVQNINSAMLSVEKSAFSMKAKTKSISTELKTTQILVIILIISIMMK